MIPLIILAYWQPWLVLIAGGIVLSAKALRLGLARAPVAVPIRVSRSRRER
jgi:hypothetical protein